MRAPPECGDLRNLQPELTRDVAEQAVFAMDTRSGLKVVEAPPVLFMDRERLSICRQGTRRDNVCLPSCFPESSLVMRDRLVGGNGLWVCSPTTL